MKLSRKQSIDTIAKNIVALLSTSLTKQLYSSSKLLQYHSKLTRSHLFFDLISAQALSDSALNLSIDLCTIIELLNTATQIHDNITQNTSKQVVSNNFSARAKLKEKLTNTISLEQKVLFGDLIFTIAFKQMLKLDNQQLLEHFSATTKNMALFEVKLSEFAVTAQTTQSDIQPLVENKYRPLFDSIYFMICFLKEHNHIKITPQQLELIRNKINDALASYSLKKIKSGELMLTIHEHQDQKNLDLLSQSLSG